MIHLANTHLHRFDILTSECYLASQEIQVIGPLIGEDRTAANE
jgi:hypothetical protein